MDILIDLFFALVQILAVLVVVVLVSLLLTYGIVNLIAYGIGVFNA